MAPLKVVLSLLIAVLSLGAVCGECEQHIAEGSCDFYQCLESRFPCGSDGYALSFGDHYCRRFGRFSSDFNEVGQLWINNVRRCLIEAIASNPVYSRSNQFDDRCAVLEKVALDSHSGCYRQNGFCDDIVGDIQNLCGLYNVLEFRNFKNKGRLVQMMWNTMRGCRVPTVLKGIGCLALDLGSKFWEFINQISEGCTDQTKLVIMFILDSSGSIGETNFNEATNFVANIVTGFDPHNTEVGVIRYSYSPGVVIGLAPIDDVDQLASRIRAIRYIGGGTYTSRAIYLAQSVLPEAEPGIIRAFILLTDGKPNSQSATERAAESAREDGIQFYAGGIGSDIHYDDLSPIASSPPDDYILNIANFSQSSFDSQVLPLQQSACLTPEISHVGNQQQGSIGQYDSRYYQYNIPPEGFTFQLNVPEGEMGVYGSYSVRNPTVLSADFETGGSGKIEYYIPYSSNQNKRQASSDTIVFITLIGLQVNNTFNFNASLGNVTEGLTSSIPVDFVITSEGPSILMFSWDRPLETNGFLTGYSLTCYPTLSGIILPEPLFHNVTRVTRLLPQNATLSGLYPGVPYNCSVSASNSVGYGTSAHEVAVTLEIAPSGSPENFTVIAGSRNVTLFWDPPATTLRNGIITGYRLQCTPDMDTFNTVSRQFIEAGKVLIDGFHPFAVYNCTLSASNSKGNGPVTYTDVTTLQDNPDGPPKDVITSVVRHLPEVVQFSCSPPHIELQNGIIEGYSIMCESSASKPAIKSVTPNETTEVRGFAPGSEYSCSVAAFTAAGEGPKTTVSLLTLPSAPQNISINQNSSELMIEWIMVPPGQTITYFTVYVNESAYYSQELFYNISILGSNQLVRVQVSATNGAGEGPRSELTTGRTGKSGPSSSLDKDSNIGALAGGISAGLLVLVCVIACCCLCCYYCCCAN